MHRIGRTGRAGNVGVAYTILTMKDEKRLADVEAFIGMKIDRIRVSEPPQVHASVKTTPQTTSSKKNRSGKKQNFKGTRAKKGYK